MATQYSQSVIGAVVEIQSSHSTRQRMPHLIGKIGTIKVIPTHPSTWYVIDIPKLGVVRLQPTGFHVVSISNLTTDSKHYNRVMEYISNKKICDNDVANDNNIDESEPIPNINRIRESVDLYIENNYNNLDHLIKKVKDTNSLCVHLRSGDKGIVEDSFIESINTLSNKYDNNFISNTIRVGVSKIIPICDGKIKEDF